MTPGQQGWSVNRRQAGAAALALLALAAAFWAGRATLRPPPAHDAAPVTVSYTVRDGHVGRTLDYTASAQWPAQPAGRIGSSGVITGVALRGARSVDEGARLFSVNERPVVVAQGKVPAYADMAYGSRGRVVAQLQGYLKRAGFYLPPIDGEFDSSLTSAVMTWQRSDGHAGRRSRATQDIFLPHLPSRIQLSQAITVGAQATQGEWALETLGARPNFWIELGAGQQNLVPLTTPVVVEHREERWRGRVAHVRESSSGDVELELSGISGSEPPLCASSCDAVPTRGTTNYPAHLVVVPRTSGPLVPAAALRTGADGSVYVTSEQGDRQSVTILASDGGWSVVRGVSAGQVIQLSGPGS